MNLILIFILASVVGMAAKLKQKHDSLKDLAVKGNFSFPSIPNFLLENKSAIIWNIIAVGAFQVTVGKALMSIISNSSDVPEMFFGGWVPIARRDVITSVIILVYMTVAFMGQDYLFGWLNRTSKDMRKAIDYKTTIADEATNNTNTPTPIK